jgi:CBS domain containing-hemolysin-like protein
MDDPASALYVTDLGSYAAQLAGIVVCFLVLAFSSLSEAAIMRVEVVRVKQLAEQSTTPRWGARPLVDLLGKRQEVLSSLILLINMSIIVASALATQVTLGLSGGSERWVPMTSLGMIAFLLVFCEVTPKTYAVRRSEAVALAAAPVLSVIHRAVHPLGRVLHILALWLIRRVLVPVIGGKVLASWPTYSDEEVIELVEAGEQDGDIEREEREMIAGVIEFADKVTREVMTPRTDMVCMAAEASLEQVARVSEQSGYSRLPVYEGNVDHIIGIVYAKDVVAALAPRGLAGGPGEHMPRAGRSTPGGTATAGQLARKPAPVVPESKKLDELLGLMQRKRLHMAIVIDEYGGTAGLVTIEDLLEEIFGEIRDEYDLEGEPIRAVEETTLLVEARVSVDEIEEALGVGLPEGEFDSVGGFILAQLGRLPSVGERVVWRDLEFTVEAVSENRVERIRVVRNPEGGQDEEGNGYPQ